MTSTAIYWILLNAFVLHSSCYYLSVDKDLPIGSKIFEFSKDFYSAVKYSLLLSHENTSTLPFFLDENIGSIYYMPLNHVFSSKKFDFKVLVSHKHYTLTVPFQVKFVSKNSIVSSIDNFFNTTIVSQVFLFKHQISVIVNHLGSDTVFAGLYSHQYPSILFPQTFCNCKVVNFTKILLPTYFKLEQFFWSCNSKAVSIPNQKILVNIKLNQNLSNFNDKNKIVMRKKRTLLNQLHFNSPNYTYYIQENRPKNTFVCRIQAYEQNGQVSQGVQYGLEAVENKFSLKLFKIDTNGRVFTNAVLDHEQMSRHAFRVTANRYNTHQVHTLLDIIVIDSNDNKPIFLLPNFYKIEIDENQRLNTPILRINAYDSDEGPNGEITYNILKVSPQSLKSCFAIRPDGNLVVNGSIDHERQDQYNITVIAKDHGEPPQLSFILIRVDITDINDNVPQFSKSVYNVNVNEDISVGKIIETVSAPDRDAGENGKVMYSLIHGNEMNKFSVNPKTGQITVRKKLDYEEGDKVYYLTVRASDGGHPPWTNTTTVKVNIIDVNDNSPQFYSSSYRFNVFENARINSFVGRVQAYDRDDGENSKITYSIVQKSSTARRMFNINHDSGAISVAGHLDYETIKSFRFYVRATDNGQGNERFVQTEVTVNVKDVNDNAPQFTLAQYTAKIPEDTPVSSDIKQIQAIDPDKQTTLEISYAITGGDPSKKFSIVSRGGIGIIKLNKRLDYKKKSSYRLTVTASDGYHSNSTVVLISIMDTNSYQPIFERTTYSADIKENASIGTEVIQVHANDNDAGENARVTYCFTSKTK